MKYAESFFLACIVAIAGCSGEGIVIPGAGDIVVTTQTTGTDVDANGYMVKLNDGAELAMEANDRLVFPDVYEGEHFVALSGIAPNCVTAAANPRRVAVASGQEATVSFNVNCLQAGQLAVTTLTSGDSIDFAYTVNLVGNATRLATASDTVEFDMLMPGDYTVRMEGVSVNCGVNGDNPRVVTVAGGLVAETTFILTCSPALLGRIVFASERAGNSEIYSMTDRGTDLYRITDDPATDRSPAISPDGTRIAFESDRDGDFNIYVVNIDGSGIVQLTDAPTYDGEPNWSANGQFIAFMSERDGNPEIYVMNADGTGKVNITRHGSTDRTPAWSPDGRQIAFSCERLNSERICVSRPDGSRLRILTGNAGTDVGPTWSPDGARIAFASDRDGNWEVYALDVDTGHTVRVTEDPDADIAPAWSPDGRRIAVATDRDGDLEIYYYDVATHRVVKLTDDGAVDTSPFWSPER